MAPPADGDRLRFVEADHAYFLDGRRVPAVSDILEPYWKAEYFAAGAAAMERARQIGNAVHLAIHLDLTGRLDESTIDPAIAGHFARWREFRAAAPTMGIEFTASELRTFHAGLGYAGTLDIEGTIWGEPFIADAKSGSVVSKVARLQTAGYAIARASHRAIDFRKYRRAVLQLRPDKWRFVETNDAIDFTAFQSAIALHHFFRK